MPAIPLDGNSPRGGETITVKARDPDPPRGFLPEPTDLIAIGRIAWQLAERADIHYTTPWGERRRLRVFAGGWWDSPARRDHEGKRSAWL